MPSQDFQYQSPTGDSATLSITPSQAQDPFGIMGGESIQPMVGVVSPPVDTRVYLDPDDPFDRAIIPIVEVSHRKRADYADDSDAFSNFRLTASFAGFEAPYVSALFNCSQKMARIQALRANGRVDTPANEAIYETILDLATYAVLALAMYEEDKRKT